MFYLTQSTRLRPSPFYEATIADGVRAFSVYNNMLMPTGYGDPEGEYRRLLEGVAMWDVAVERQVQLRGADAARLAQVLSARDLSRLEPGQGKYVPLCNHAGTLINDPVVLKLDDECFWFSIADSNILFWARAIAAERGFNVEVLEPDVSPLAVQGPKAPDVVAAIFGDWVRDLKYFWFRQAEVDGIDVVVARSGWSKQGGFELYLRDGTRGAALWQRIKEAGAPWGIGPGNPNQCERVESGLLSWGGDTDDETNPFEVRMGPYVDLDLPDEVIGIRALRRIKAEGVKRHLLGIRLAGDTPRAASIRWSAIDYRGERIGSMTTSTWSYRLRQNIGFALVSTKSRPGDAVTVDWNGKHTAGELTALPFL